MNDCSHKPKWLWRKIPASDHNSEVKGLTNQLRLHTVCVEAHCPNQMECYGRGEATFILLGPSCTRRCAFCAVDKSAPVPPDPLEPQRTAVAIAELNLKFAVLTMVTRDDLYDGGADHISKTVLCIREKCPDVGIEVLISDLGGDPDALQKVIFSSPDVLNHNVETVPRLYSTVRPQADYRRSIDLIRRVKQKSSRIVAKSGLMLGLGENRDEVLSVMDELREAGCQLITLGQYLAPSKKHHPVVRYVHPDEFDEYASQAYQRGFSAVASAPFVRSSYRAGKLHEKARLSEGL